MIFAVPAFTGVNKPVVAFIVALDKLLEVHTPPGVAFVIVTVVPPQTIPTEGVAAGRGLIVMSLVRIHPKVEV